MLNNLTKERCCGCAACAQSCPVQCISMCPDDEGFLYPEVSETHCLKCGICERVCPAIYTQQKSGKVPIVYASYNKNEEERSESSSGGVFTLLAKETLKSGGVVFGAAMNDDCRSVHHVMVKKKDELYQLCGSKYLQSDVEKTYHQAEECLKKGRQVLYSGTPCEIHGLKSYLKKEYENLLCVSVICHGVPSPKLWEKYVCYREEQVGAKVHRAFFRHKRYGWRMFTLLFEFSNGRTCKEILYKDLFIQMFLQNLCLRPSCYNCIYKGLQGVADISLADFWGIEAICPEMDDDKGLSMVLLHTKKGQTFFDSIHQETVSMLVEFEQAVLTNRAVVESCAKPNVRDLFMKDIDLLSIKELGKKYLVMNSLPVRIRIWVSVNIKKKIMRMLGKGNKYVRIH